MRASWPILILLCGCIPMRRGPGPGDAIVDASLNGEGALRKLVELCDDVGHRLSGSPGLERAVEWAVKTLEADGHENVRAEPVRVPKWVRGRESLVLVEPREYPMVLLGLGGSVGTPPEGITAEVVVVRDKKELDAIGDGAKGKIVLFNYPMPPYDPEQGTKYGETVTYRVNGALWASEKGAVAALVRSVTAHSLRTPHTGGMNYGNASVKIPTAAVAVEDAELLARLAARGKRPTVRLTMEARNEGEADSANVIAELRGREKPDEIVVISGHLDSWDVGQGAHDDGAGCVIAMEALSVIRKLGIRPRRTIRVVLWTNEENGMAGVKTYLRDHAAELPKHVAAMESDSGGFRPEGFNIDHADPAKLEIAGKKLGRLLGSVVRIGSFGVKPGGSAPDVGHFKAHGVVCLGLWVDDSIYFDYHHTPADTVDKVDPDLLAKGVAAMAVTAFLIADSDDWP